MHFPHESKKTVLLGVNLHHWHWHMIYPYRGTLKEVNKDRRGELFYYMHQQLIARYNSERICNNLPIAKAFVNWDGPLEEAYYPKLDRILASRILAFRQENQMLKDVNRFTDISVGVFQYNVSNLFLWRDKIYEAINSGVMKSGNGTLINLRKVNGIDILFDTLEPSILSPNREYYGALHQAGHVLISLVHDPLYLYLEPVAPMGLSSVSMRDPAFYRWHTFVNNISRDFKRTLPSYKKKELANPGVIVEKIAVRVPGQPDNQLQTFLQRPTVKLERGIDFYEKHPVKVRFTQVNHKDFVYKIQVKSNKKRQATCRIFLSPRYNDARQPWLLEDQKEMFIELDKFVVDLKKGTNVITRNSTESSVTIPFDQTFRDLQTNKPVEGDALLQFNFCGCGWPHNLLIPRGKPEGVAFQIFVMLSDIKKDQVFYKKRPLLPSRQNIGGCVNAPSMCGIQDKLYPDARPMDYPFDRFPGSGIKMLHEFLTPNMKVSDIVIYHNNTIPQ